jgi:hypothetical protein
MSLKTITVETDAAGEFTYERRLAGIIKAIAIDIGDLETPDIVITDGVWDTEILSLTALAADGVFQVVAPAQDEDGVVIADAYVAPAIFGTLKIEVTGGGANKTGTIRLIFA